MHLVNETGVYLKQCLINCIVICTTPESLNNKSLRPIIINFMEFCLHRI